MPASFFNSRCAVLAITALLFCLFTSPTTQARRQDAVESLYQKARAAESQKQYEQAAEHYERILKLDPTLHPLRANLGLMRYFGGEYGEAVKNFRQALAADDKLYTAYLFLGLSLLELNQTTEASSHLERAVRDNPRDVNARFGLARAYYLAERHRDALKQLQSLRELQPDDAEALYLLGRVHLKLSLEAYGELKKRDPEHYRIYQLLGENYEVQGLNNPAIANFRKALERNPRARGINLKLGEIYSSTGEIEQALEAFRQELILNPQNAYAMYRVGNILLEQNKPDEAAGYLEKSISIDPNSAPARVSYGRYLLAKKRLPEAIAQFRSAVKFDAEAEAGWFQLAQAYRLVGDSAAAQEALQMYEKLKRD